MIYSGCDREQVRRLLAAALCQVLLVSIVVAAPVSAKEAPIPETRRKIPPHGIPPEVKAEVSKVQERVERWYPLLGHKLGVHLANPNIVLLLADERGLADLNFYNWTQADVDAIARFNKAAEADGIRISYLKTAREGDAEVDGWLENLHGYQRVSNSTKLAGIPPFQAATGWQGLDEWKARAVEGVARVYTQEIDKSIQPAADWYFPTARAEAISTAILRGLAYGYPDTAIYSPDAKAKYAFTIIPYGDFHRASEPNFSYAGDCDLKAVNKIVNRWGTVLAEYYHSPEYLKLAEKDDFKTARLIADGFGQKKD
ncbi:MAG: hypothetical protein AB7W16_25225 [Candidatus Obscuribacterales bacterium]